MNSYWTNYLSNRATTTPASLALQAGLTGFVAESAIPRFINTAGDLQLNVDWQLNDRINDTNFDRSTFEATISMQNRNWTTPFLVRESLN